MSKATDLSSTGPSTSNNLQILAVSAGKVNEQTYYVLRIFKHVTIVPANRACLKIFEENMQNVLTKSRQLCSSHWLSSTWNDLSGDMSLKFYYDLMSQPSRALYIIFKMSDIKYEDYPVALRNGEHLTEQFKTNINRFQKVPCIIDDKLKLAESVAILRYLSSKGKITELLYPKYFVEQARVDEFLEWQHSTIRLTNSHFFRYIWLDPLVKGTKPTQAKIEKLRIHMERNLDIVEQIWLEKNEFLAGKKLTAADIFAACEIEQIRMADYDVRIKYPKIAAWLKRVRASCNPHYDDAHKIVYKISGTAPNSKL